jgi:hypothetical protein
MSRHKSNYLLLPSDYAFIEHLKENHDIDITEEDFKQISLFYNTTSQTWERRLSSDPHSTWFEVRNGRVLGVIAFAAAGFFLAPVLGLGALTGALLGASIGWKLFGGGNRKNTNANNNVKEEKAAQTFGFNSAPSVTPIGGVIPLVFTNQYLNPNGGVRTSGVVLHSSVDTFGGVQRLLTIYGLCLGEIGEVAEPDILINGQPRVNFFSNEITTITRYGSDQQSYINFFGYYSQCISVANNNQLGISKRGKHIGSSSTSTNFLFVNADEFDNYVPTDIYIINSQEFTIISKNPSNNSIQTDRLLNINTNDEIFSTYRIKYETSKKCSEIQLNLVSNLWGRDSNNALLQHGVLFSCYINGAFIGRFLLSNKSEADVRRRFIIRNLLFQKHTVELYPVNFVSDASGIYPISDIQQVTRINTGVYFGSNEVQIEYENASNVSLSVSQINSIINLNKAQTSNDRGAVTQLTTVNEIVYPIDLGHDFRANYKGVCIGALIAQSSNRLQSDPAPSWKLKRGLFGRIHFSAGRANNSSTNNLLVDITANFLSDNFGVGNDVIIRNLDKGIEGLITNFSLTTVTTATSLFWESGDRYLIYQANQSLCYFPDIYVWTLTSTRGGLGSLMHGVQMSDYFIDYESIVESRKFCLNNGYFWDGVIDEQVNWSQWATFESTASLLFPTRIGGKFGLIPEGSRNPIALFNASNILPDTYYEEYAPIQKLNCVHITYTDNSDNISKEKTVSIITNAAYFGTEALFAESLKFESITNQHQAVRVAQIFLKSRVLQDRVISFSTALQGFSIREGDFIIVQHLTTEIEKECSGFVLESISFNAGTQKLILSSPSPIGIGTQYSAAIYRLESGSVQQNLTCSGIKEGNPARNVIQIQGLSEPLKIPRENYTGDYVIVGKDTTHRRTYRTQEVKPNDDGSVTITAVLWIPEILSTDGLVTVN